MKTIILCLILSSISFALCDTYQTSVARAKESAKKYKAEKILFARGGGGPGGGVHVYTFLMVLPKKQNMLATIQVEEPTCQVVADSYAIPEELKN